jgi:DNA-directed RNA polymerase specialized sigma subunit
MPTIAETYKMLDEYQEVMNKILEANKDIRGLMSALGENCIMITQNYGKLMSMPISKQASDPVYYAYQQAENLNKTYQDKIGHLAIKIVNMINLKNNVDLALAKLNVNERKILVFRCLQHMSWEDIGEKMLYSERQLRRLKNIAIKKLTANLA